MKIKTGKKALSFLLAGIMTLGLTLGAIITPMIAYADVGDWSGGDGSSAEQAITISDPEGLAKLAAYVNSGNDYVGTYFELTKDIDLDAYSSDAGWTPIGNKENPFKGIFNGNGYVVRNLKIDRPDERYVGLFGHVSGGTILNLGVESLGVIGDTHVGGIVGANNVNGKIINCYNTGAVSGENEKVGGIAGINQNYSIIKNCYNTGAVTGKSYQVGGITGDNAFYATVTNCYNTGRVAGTDEHVSGIAGKQYNPDSIINCLNIGAVYGDSGASSIVGDNAGLYNYRYAMATVNGRIPTVNDPGSNHGGIKTAEELMKKETYTGFGWTFDENNWEWDTARLFPRLAVMKGEQTNPLGFYTVTYNINGGSGTVPRSVLQREGETFMTTNITGITPPAGKRFKEWNTKQEGDGISYAAGAMIIMQGDNLTLYAIWMNNPSIFYTATYNLNGVDGTAPAEIYKGQGETFAAAYAADLTASGGMGLEEWNTEPDGTGTRYAPGATVIMPGNNLTLYAIWANLFEGYNANDVQKIYNFLKQVNDDGVSNADILSWDANDPEAWYGAYWTDTGNELRLEYFEILDAGVHGVLDLSGCTDLQELHCANNMLTALDLSGCTDLQELHCANNMLTALDVSGCENLDQVVAYDNKIASLKDVKLPISFRSITLKNNLLTDLDGIEFFPSDLEVLGLNGNQITSLYGVVFPASLEGLGLQNNLLTDITDAAFPDTLDWLELAGNQIPYSLKDATIAFLDGINNGDFYYDFGIQGVQGLRQQGQYLTEGSGITYGESIWADMDFHIMHEGDDEPELYNEYECYELDKYGTYYVYYDEDGTDLYCSFERLKESAGELSLEITTKLVTADGSNKKVSFDVTLNAPEKGVLYVAVYANGKMLAFERVNINGAQFREKSFDFTVPTYASYTVKAFYWENDTMKPYCVNDEKSVAGNGA